MPPAGRERTTDPAMPSLERQAEPDAVRALINRIDRRDSPARKIERAAEARVMTLRFMEAGIRHQHPDWTGEQVRMEVIRRLLPRELHQEVYGPSGGGTA